MEKLKDVYSDYRMVKLRRLKLGNESYYMSRKMRNNYSKRDISVFRHDGWYNYPNLIETVNWKKTSKKRT